MTKSDFVAVEKTPVTWYLVADSRQGQVYTREKLEKIIPIAGGSKHDKFSEETSYELVAVPSLKWQAESTAEYEVGKNATGMVHESSGGARHMSEPHIDVRDEVREHFARALAKNLEHAAAEKSFDKLVLVAPAKMLGEIKKHLSDKLAKLVSEEIHKDLTHCTAKELTDNLAHAA